MRITLLKLSRAVMGRVRMTIKFYITTGRFPALLENAGYKVRLLEWFDEQGKFHHEDWNAKDGFVMRSTRFDQRNRTNPTAYTSLIIDASKP